MQSSLSSTAWLALHLIVAGAMATMGSLDLRLWWQDRDQQALRVTGALCWSVALTLLTGAVGLALPTGDVFRVVVPVRAIFIGVTAALFLSSLNAMVKLPGIRVAMILSLALPMSFALAGDLSFGFTAGSGWPQIRPLGQILAGLGALILVGYTIRALFLVKGKQRYQLAGAAVSASLLFSIAITAGQGVLTEAMTTLWTLPIAVLLAVWSSVGVLTTRGSLLSAVAGWREAERMADHQARHDPLTGLPNAAVATEALQALLESQESATVIVVSAVRLSRLEAVRAAEGSSRVDSFLCAFADQLRTSRPANVVVARVGDGSFIALTTLDRQLAPQPKAELLVEQAVHRLRHAVIFPPEVTIAVGITTNDGLSSATDLLQRAGMAASSAQELRSVVQFYRPELRAEIIERARIGRLLRSAIDRDEFEVHYQPVIETTSMRRIGVEALVRWRHLGKLHQPLDWIPLAEQQGLMAEIGLHVMRTAVRDHARLQCPIAVNVSPRQFTDREFVGKVLDVLQSIPAGAISLEITESSIIGNLEHARTALDTLRAHGIRIALDDFGTEYSSLSRLVSLPFDVLKIDRSFIANVLSTEGRAIVAAIQAMAHAIGKTTIAEGVETVAELQAVREIGCAGVQGFLTGRAKNLSDLLAPSFRQPHEDPWDSSAFQI